MSEKRIHAIIADAFRAANVKFESSARDFRIELGKGRALAVCLTECPSSDIDDKRQVYSVRLHATYAGTFYILASSKEEAEELVRARYEAEDAKKDDFEIHRTECCALKLG